MKGLRAGGMALVVRSTDLHEVGRTVTLLRLVSPGEEFTAPGDVPCRWPFHFDPSWLVSGDVQCNMPSGAVFYGWAVFPPTNLMPIDDSDPDGADEMERGKPVGVSHA